MKKILVSLLLLVTMIFNVVAMASCGSTGSGEKPNVDDIIGELDNAGYQVPEGGYDGSEVTITFFHTMSATKLQPTLDLYIKEFNKLYPNITIEHSAPGGYDDVLDQIKTEIAAGNQPNIAYCYPDHVASYLVARSVVPLDNLINSKIEVTDAKGNKTVLGLTAEQIADFVPGYYAEGAVYDEKGTMYTLPLSKSTEALYYNKTFFDEHGLKVPTTWDEMEETIKKIKEIDPDSIPLGYDSESNWFITMCEQLDSGYTSLEVGNHFSFDNEANRAFVKRFAQWYKNGWVTTEEQYGSYTSGLFTNTTPNETTGKIQRSYMVIGSTGGASYQTPPEDNNGYSIFETAMATIPQVDENNRKVISQGPSLCIFKKDNPQEVIASWLFVKFLTTNVGFQSEFSMKSGYAPVIKSAQDNALYSEWLNTAQGKVTDGVDEEGNPIKIPANITALSVKLALSQADAYYVSPAFNGSSEARKQVGLIMINVFASERTDVDKLIDEEFKKAMQECEYAAAGK